MDSRQSNPARTTANAWWITTALAVLAIFIPPFFDIEDSAGLILVMIAGFFMAIVGLIVAIIYQMRAAKLDSILKGDNVLGALALIGLIAWFTAFYNHRQNRNNQGYAFFTPDAVYINRQLHDFKGMMSRLEKVDIKGDSGRYIEFIYSSPTRTGRQNYEARMPIPQGKDDEARKLVEKYLGMLDGTTTALDIDRPGHNDCRFRRR